MRTLLLIYFSITGLISFSLDYNKIDTYYNHLYEVNKQWAKYKSICPKGTIKFNNEKERISLHLKLVSNQLVNNESSNLSQNQLKNRHFLILELLEYANNTIFPENLFHKERTPYFIDYNNVHCAVGYLMKQSGHENLALQIKKEYNYDYVKDIDTKGVLEWSIEQGFTIDELKWIQPSYPVNYFVPLQSGANNNINKLTLGNPNLFIISGEFDSLNNMPCLSIGTFKDDQFSCLGNGLNGQINDVVYTYPEGVVACGEIINGNTTYPCAIFNNGWNYYSIPNRPNAVGIACLYGNSGNKFEIVISTSNHHELWYLTNSNIWEKKAELNGPVYDIKTSIYGKVYAGKFDSVFVYNNNSITDTILTTNAVIKKYSQPIWFGVGNDVPNEIYAVGAKLGSIYFGGKCSNAGDICLTRYLNNTLQPLLISGNQLINGIDSTEIKINDILITETNIIIGGDFKHIGFSVIDNWGQNLVTYDPITNETSSFGYTNAQVNAILNYNNQLYIAGDFTSNLGVEMNHIARKENPNSLDEIKIKVANVFPNPTNGLFSVSTTSEPIDKIEIYDMLGKVVFNQENINSNKKDIDISSFKKGTYYITVYYSNNKETHPIIKL